jgi:rod shape-determining protein MreC
LQEHPRSIYRIVAPAKGFVHRFLYMGLVLAALGLMLLSKADAVLMERVRAQVADAFTPILDAASRPMATVLNFVDEIHALAAVREANEKLLIENTRLLQWQAVARKLEAENASLRGLLKFSPEPSAKFITARVIGDAERVFVKSLLLNTGSIEGVRKGQAVISGDGLVGRVVDVGARSSRVLLLQDINSRIPVVVASTRARAILAGKNRQPPHLLRLPAGTVITPGDLVTTSGHGGAFPPGLSVGRVISVGKAGVIVQPYVKFDHLEYVRVVDFSLGKAPQRSTGKTDRKPTQ